MAAFLVVLNGPHRLLPLHCHLLHLLLLKNATEVDLQPLVYLG